MSWSDKIVRAVFGEPPNPARQDASDMEERRIARASLVKGLRWSEKELERNPDSKICQAGLAAARQRLKDFDNS